MTTSFDESDIYNPWTSVVVTETILTEFITYMQNGTVDGVTSEFKTVNQTKTMVGPMNETITHSTPTFILEPTPGVYLTMNAGPTYVVYNDLSGGLDQAFDFTFTALKSTSHTCAPRPTRIENWEPTNTEHWSHFIETYATQAPSPVTDMPVPLPSKLVLFLKQDQDVIQHFNGADIATCTVDPGTDLSGPGLPPPDRQSPLPGTQEPHPTPHPEIPEAPSRTGARPSTTEVTATVPATAPATMPPFESVTTGTFLSTTFASTSTHVTRQGCLRCQNTKPFDEPEPTPDGRNTAGATPTYKPDEPNKPDDKPKPNGQDKPADKPDSNQVPTPNIPDILASIINNNPNIWTRTSAGQSVTIGNSVFPINTPQPTQNDQNRPNEQYQVPPVIIIGTETFTPGQTKTINGVPVVAPTNGDGSRIVVDGNTITYNPSPTGPPVLTVGQNTITANPSGHFVIGTETLSPGGPPITASGSTFSIAPSANIVVVNGITQTLAHAPAPTAGPILTVGSQAITATLISGTPAYILGPDQTLTPGGVLTISGSTISLPATGSGTIVVINGVTSTLPSPAGITAAPAITINGRTYPATIRDGTTEYVIAAGTTLRPGDAVTMDGTTYSLDAEGTALVVNGQTSKLPTGPASNSASVTSSPSSSRTRSSTSTAGRGAGDLIASGIGESSKAGGVSARGDGVDKWIERIVVGAVGWVVLLL